LTTKIPPKPESFLDSLCAVYASSTGEDPIGHAGVMSRALCYEIPTPWGDDLYTGDPAGTPTQRVRAIQQAYFARWRETGLPFPATGNPGLYGIAPDEEFSTPGLRRVLLAIRPEGMHSGYDVAAYEFPFDAPELVDLAEAYFNAPQDLTQFDSYRLAEPPSREFMVCTHGHVDICCAKFGIPLYQQARANLPLARAWRITHFGGHRFAPTAWELPTGLKWAFLDEVSAAHVLNRDVPAADLALKLRGNSSLPTYVQVLDREGLKAHDWAWLDARRSGEVLEADDEGKHWRVRLDYELPSGERGYYEGVVGVQRELPLTGCGTHWGEYDSMMDEYRLESFRDVLVDSGSVASPSS
jgi:hypothetical protein